MARYYARKEAGLCVSCGGPREAPADEGGKQRLTCAACHAKREAYVRQNTQRLRRIRMALRLAGLCVECRKPRDIASRAEDRAACSSCREKERLRQIGVRAEKRKRTSWGAARDGRPLPFSGAVPRLGAVYRTRVSLDPEAFGALRELLRKELKEQERVAETLHQMRQPLDSSQHRKRELFEGVELEYRVSRVVRAAIRQFADKPAPSRKFRPFWTDRDELVRRMIGREAYRARLEGIREAGQDREQALWDVPPPRTCKRLLGPTVVIGVALDAECLRIVERDANELYRGNKSEAVRALLCAANLAAKSPLLSAGGKGGAAGPP